MNTPILPSEEVRITHKSTVSLHFEVSLMNGEVIDSTFHRQEPVTLTIGDESLLAGFEKVLINLKAGDTRTATLSADDAFGQWNPENVQTFTRTQFALSEPNPVVGMISLVTDDEVLVDFNHPLAGQDVLFKVQIFKVTPPNQVGFQLRSS